MKTATNAQRWVASMQGNAHAPAVLLQHERCFCWSHPHRHAVHLRVGGCMSLCCTNRSTCGTPWLVCHIRSHSQRSRVGVLSYLASVVMISGALSPGQGVEGQQQQHNRQLDHLPAAGLELLLQIECLLPVGLRPCVHLTVHAAACADAFVVQMVARHPGCCCGKPVEGPAKFMSALKETYQSLCTGLLRWRAEVLLSNEQTADAGRDHWSLLQPISPGIYACCSRKRSAASCVRSHSTQQRRS